MAPFWVDEHPFATYFNVVLTHSHMCRANPTRTIGESIEGTVPRCSTNTRPASATPPVRWEPSASCAKVKEGTSAGLLLMVCCCLDSQAAFSVAVACSWGKVNGKKPQLAIQVVFCRVAADFLLGCYWFPSGLRTWFWAN